MSRVRVRPARVADLDRLAAWAIALAQETEGRGLDAATVRRGVERGLRDPALARYFLAEVVEGSAATPAGTLMLTTEWSDWRCAHWWWIQSVYVAPGLRRRGVLRALHAHVRAQAEAEAQVCGLRLYVEKANAAALASYAALGLRDAGYAMYECELETS